MIRFPHLAFAVAGGLAVSIAADAWSAEQLKGRFVVRDGEGTASPIDMTIETICQDGIPIFVVTNDGGRWPGRANVRVFKVATNEQTTERQMVLTAGQRFRFRVGEAGKDEYGLWVEPSWLKREKKFDAKVKC